MQDRPAYPQSRPAKGARGAPTFSVVVPVYNEAGGLPEFHRRLSGAMDRVAEPWEVIYVNDGSRDGSLDLLETLRDGDRRCAIVNLSRNFGKEIAMTAGLDHARGAAV